MNKDHNATFNIQDHSLLLLLMLIVECNNEIIMEFFLLQLDFVQWHSKNTTSYKTVKNHTERLRETIKSSFSFIKIKIRFE